MRRTGLGSEESAGGAGTRDRSESASAMRSQTIAGAAVSGALKGVRAREGVFSSQQSFALDAIIGAGGQQPCSGAVDIARQDSPGVAANQASAPTNAIARCALTPMGA